MPCWGSSVPGHLWPLLSTTATCRSSTIMNSLSSTGLNIAWNNSSDPHNLRHRAPKHLRTTPPLHRHPQRRWSACLLGPRQRTKISRRELETRLMPLWDRSGTRRRHWCMMLLLRSRWVSKLQWKTDGGVLPLESTSSQEIPSS